MAMNVEGAGMFSKAKYFLGIVGFILIFSQLIIAISGSVYFLIKTGDAKPLISDTGGYLVGNDASVLQSVNELKNPSISKEYSDYLKSRILQGLIGLGTSIFLTYLIVRWLFTRGLPADHMSAWNKMFLMVVAFVFITIAGVLYKGIILHSWSVNPFLGITELIKNWAVLSNVGMGSIFSSDVLPNALNTTINATGAI